METLVKGFKKLFIAGKEWLLKNWTEETVKSDRCLSSFDKNFLKDYDAVNNTVITTVNNG
jgi:hypothetical protein